MLWTQEVAFVWAPRPTFGAHLDSSRVYSGTPWVGQGNPNRLAKAANKNTFLVPGAADPRREFLLGGRQLTFRAHWDPYKEVA